MRGHDWALDALRCFPHVPSAQDAEAWPSPERRLLDALVQASRRPDARNHRDVVALARHVLLAGTETTFSEWIPVSTDIAPAGVWQEAGFERATRSAQLHVRARQWQPTWLPGADAEPPAQAALLGRYPNLVASSDNGPAADPFFRDLTGWPKYRSHGQRMALQSLLASQPGTTVIANLPTRSGKSMVAFVPALLGAKRRQSAVVVVPTTALALDQERQFLSLASRRGINVPAVLAYHGELADAVKEDVRRRLRDGEQVIIFTSPESLAGGLRPALDHAAREGRISLYAVDEAHTVSQWGDDFRPDFQALGGIRKALLQAASGRDVPPFSTLLMTGTLTSSSLDALVMLFPSAQAPVVVSAVALREEPSYWSAGSADEEDRSRNVLEALDHLPRPSILYTTRVEDADRWYERLTAHGYRRVAKVTGETSGARRREVILGVRGEIPGGDVNRTTVDLVVATSAYGLGVDQDDVRAIVHACLPESIDRYYQEVGRGGRDGRPAVSLLLWTPSDDRAAERLSLTTVIGIDKARKRWESMWSRRRLDSHGGTVLRLDTVPPYQRGNNQRSEQWNFLTLLLMQRADLLTLGVVDPPRRETDESEEDWEIRREAAYRDFWLEVAVTDIAPDLADPTVWTLIEKAAKAIHERDRRSLNLMREARDGSRPMTDVLADAYRVERGQSLTMPELSFEVARGGGTCPFGRHHGQEPRRDVAPAPGGLDLTQSDTTLTGSLDRLVPRDGTPLTVHFDPATPDTRRRLQRQGRQLVESVVAAGVRVLVGRDDALGVEAFRDVWQKAPRRSTFSAERWSRDQLRHLPASPAIFTVAGDVRDDELRRFYRSGSRRLVLVSSDRRDFDKRQRPLIAARTPSMPLEELLARLG